MYMYIQDLTMFLAWVFTANSPVLVALFVRLAVHVVTHIHWNYLFLELKNDVISQMFAYLTALSRFAIALVVLFAFHQIANINWRRNNRARQSFLYMYTSTCIWCYYLDAVPHFPVYLSHFSSSAQCLSRHMSTESLSTFWHQQQFPKVELILSFFNV